MNFSVACAICYSILQISGIDMTVQINKSKFGRHKKFRNDREHCAEDVWVFRKVKFSCNSHYHCCNKYFAVWIPDRTMDMLTSLIKWQALYSTLNFWFLLNFTNSRIVIICFVTYENSTIVFILLYLT